MAENYPYDLGSFISDNNHRISHHEIGRGAYGTVYELTVNGVWCIAKRIHEILKPQGHSREEDAENVVFKKFTQECQLLNSLRHPNIVQCFGICKVPFGINNSEDVLLMEYMHMDLDHCLSYNPNIVLPIKLSVLCDVSHGLLHLHSQRPPIIHRDLTASNILLTPDMRAKIADLGMCKMLDALRFTQAPGALGYMPPEALTEQPKYDHKLDIFSFGVVALFLGIQVFPIPYEVQQGAILQEALERNEVQLLKRKCWMTQLCTGHPLCQLITKCLQDTPAMRPSTQDLCSDVEQLCNQYPWVFVNILESDVPDQIRQELVKENKVLHFNMLEMEAEVREKQAEDLKYMKEKEVEFEDMVKEYTVVQREFEEAKGEYERELHEIKQEHKCELLEKELQQIRMQKEMQEGRTLLRMESMKKENEYKQIFEHFLSEQSAERLLQQNNIRQIEERRHVEVKSLQDEVKELKSANNLLQQQIHQIEERRHVEVKSLQDEVKELKSANNLLQQQNSQIEYHCLELKSEVQTLQRNITELENARSAFKIQAEEHQADFMREREDREALAGRLSEYEERENERQRRSLWFNRRNPRDTS